MAISFVEPDTRRLDLGDGDWIEVKVRLPFGAAEKLRTSGLVSMRAEDGAQKIDLDLGSYNLNRMVAYIVDWSARTPDGRPVKPSRDAFAALDERAAREITDALDRHIQEQEDAARDGNPTPTAIDSSSYSHAG